MPKSRAEGVVVSLSWGRGDRVVGKEGELLVVMIAGDCDVWCCGDMWILPSPCSTTGGKEEGKEEWKRPGGVEGMWSEGGLELGKGGDAVKG